MTYRTLLVPPFPSLFGIPLMVLTLHGGGCAAPARTVVITTTPADATIRVGGVERGRGRVVQKLEFAAPGQAHSVVASRAGYRDEEVFVTLDTPPEPQVSIVLKPQSRRVRLTVSPVPAVVSIDGKPVAAEPVSQVSPELEFPPDPRGGGGGQPVTHTVIAERKGWQRAAAVLSYRDPSPHYELRLEPLKKDLRIRTTPPGAQVFVDGQTLGASPVEFAGYAFPVDPDTGEFVPHVLRVTKPGYDDVEQAIGWDDGRTDYVIDLTAKSKLVRIATTPPGAVVKVDGLELPRDATGASTARLQFPPVDAAGTLKTYTATTAMPPGEQIWEPHDLTIAWDGGRKDYAVALREVHARRVPLVRWRPQRVANAWRLEAEPLDTVAVKETAEPPPAGGAGGGGARNPFRVAAAPQGWSIDSLAVSPDGTQVAYALVSRAADGALKARVELVGADGAPGAALPGADPAAVELTPTFSPDGTQLVFASTRGGRRMNVWSAGVGAAAAAAAPAARLTEGETTDLWPSLDADPKPRVFYQGFADTRSLPRLFSTRVGGNQPRDDLGQPGASQPRVSPKGDSVIFTLPDPKTGKRDVYQMSDAGGPTLNLTHTPDVDECDAVWSPDGGAIAVASDAAADEDGRRQYDVWVIDMRNPQGPRRVTANASWDDSPAWSPLGDAIYFRSNRGGSWGIWKLDLK